MRPVDFFKYFSNLKHTPSLTTARLLPFSKSSFFPWYILHSVSREILLKRRSDHVAPLAITFHWPSVRMIRKPHILATASMDYMKCSLNLFLQFYLLLSFLSSPATTVLLFLVQRSGMFLA